MTPNSEQISSTFHSAASPRPAPERGERLRVILQLMLWMFGVSGLMAAVPAVMPRSWLAAAVAAAEPGTPVLLLVEYLARSLSAMYCLIGGVMCLCARDPVRFRPMVRWLGWFSLVGGTAGFVQILLAPYPKNLIVWLLVFDAGLIAVFGAAVLTLQSLVNRR